MRNPKVFNTFFNGKIMKRTLPIRTLLLLLALFLVSSLLFGCGARYSSPEKCLESMFTALEEENQEDFFGCILSPPESPAERESLFLTLKERFMPYVGGKVMSTYETEGRTILNVSPSPEFRESYSAAFAPPPLAMAFVNEKGWKLDVEHTEKLRELHQIYKGILGGY
jgi:hypothetical protein